METRVTRNVIANYRAPFEDLAQGLERYIRGKNLKVLPRTIQTVGKFLVEAYEGCRHNGMLPKLSERYERIGASRRTEHRVSAASKLVDLYRRATREQLEDETEIGLVALRLLGLLEGLGTRNFAKSERKRYSLLFDLSRAVDLEPEGTIPALEDD